MGIAKEFDDCMIKEVGALAKKLIAEVVERRAMKQRGGLIKLRLERVQPRSGLVSWGLHSQAAVHCGGTDRQSHFTIFSHSKLMEHEPVRGRSSADLLGLSRELANVRDLLVELSLALQDARFKLGCELRDKTNRQSLDLIDQIRRLQSRPSNG